MPEDPFADTAVTPERLGRVALVAQVPIFAYLGHVLFDDVLFGGITGLLVGVGTLLHLPYFIYRSAAGSEGVEGSYARRGAAGVALDAAGIIAIGARIAVDSAVVALAAAAVAALVVFVPLQYALPPVGSDAAGA
jgi:hypothetical protein